MRIEQHPQGVNVQGPAIVIRRTGALASAPPPDAQKTDRFSPTDYTDRADLSPEARQRYEAWRAEREEGRDGAAATTLDDGQSSTGNQARISNPSVHLAPDGSSPAPAPESPTSRESDARGQGQDSDSGQQAGDGFASGQQQAESTSQGDASTAGDRDGKDKSEKHSGDAEADTKSREKIQDLKQRDREVRQHEQAHLAAAGNLAAGGAHFDYEKGPDGKQYAVGGDVQVKLGAGNTPDEKLRNAQQVERAALAPSKPSDKDRQVASEARAQEADARREISQEHAQAAAPNGTEPSRPGETDAKDETTSAVPAGEQNENEQNAARANESQDTSYDSRVIAGEEQKQDSNPSPLNRANRSPDRDGDADDSSQLLPSIGPAARAYQQQMAPTPSTGFNPAVTSRSFDTGGSLGRYVQTSA